MGQQGGQEAWTRVNADFANLEDILKDFFGGGFGDLFLKIYSLAVESQEALQDKGL